MLLAGVGAQTVREVIALSSYGHSTALPQTTVSDTKVLLRRGRVPETELDLVRRLRSAGDRLPLERQEAEQAAAITARFVSLLLLALSTDAAPKFRQRHCCTATQRASNRNARCGGFVTLATFRGTPVDDRMHRRAARASTRCVGGRRDAGPARHIARQRALRETERFAHRNIYESCRSARPRCAVAGSQPEEICDLIQRVPSHSREGWPNLRCAQRIKILLTYEANLESPAPKSGLWPGVSKSRSAWPRIAEWRRDISSARGLKRPKIGRI